MNKHKRVKLNREASTGSVILKDSQIYRHRPASGLVLVKDPRIHLPRPQIHLTRNRRGSHAAIPRVMEEAEEEQTESEDKSATDIGSNEVQAPTPQSIEASPNPHWRIKKEVTERVPVEERRAHERERLPSEVIVVRPGASNVDVPLTYEGDKWKFSSTKHMMNISPKDVEPYRKPINVTFASGEREELRSKMVGKQEDKGDYREETARSVAIYNRHQWGGGCCGGSVAGRMTSVLEPNSGERNRLRQLFRETEQTVFSLPVNIKVAHGKAAEFISPAAVKGGRTPVVVQIQRNAPVVRVISSMEGRAFASTQFKNDRLL